jgi:hypothetical protein
MKSLSQMHEKKKNDSNAEKGKKEHAAAALAKEVPTPCDRGSVLTHRNNALRRGGSCTTRRSANDVKHPSQVPLRSKLVKMPFQIY